MRITSFKVKSKMLMYRCQDMSWTNICHFALDLYDIVSFPDFTRHFFVL